MTISSEREKHASSWRELLRIGILSLLISSFCVACGQEAGAEQRSEDVTSYLEGEITLSTEIDSVADYSGFEVLIGNRTETSFDTLAITETDVEGKFSMDINAPKTNIYSLVIARDGAIVRVDEIAIADGDSASFKIQFPFGQRPIMIRSKENAALLGFKNTIALHNGEIESLSQQGVSDQTVFRKQNCPDCRHIMGIERFITRYACCKPWCCAICDYAWKAGTTPFLLHGWVNLILIT